MKRTKRRRKTMGATSFSAVGVGRDVREAFNNAVEEAHYENGHGGYTGTIAEKPSYVVHEAPSRISAEKFAGWVEDWSNYEYDHNKSFLKAIPTKYRDRVKRAHDNYDDKWGPAVAIPLAGKELKEFKKKHTMSLQLSV
jgi:hypothetical protein